MSIGHYLCNFRKKFLYKLYFAESLTLKIFLTVALPKEPQFNFILNSNSKNSTSVILKQNIAPIVADKSTFNLQNSTMALKVL